MCLFTQDLRSCHVSSMKIERKQTTEAFLNEKFIQISLLRSKGVQFLIRDDKRVSDLKELQVRFEVNLSNRAEHGFQKFRKKTIKNTKNWSIRKVFKYKFPIKPVISCELNSHKYSNVTKKVSGL